MFLLVEISVFYRYCGGGWRCTVETLFYGVRHFFQMITRISSVLMRDNGTQRAFVFWNERKIYFGKWGSTESQLKFAAWSKEVLSRRDAIAEEKNGD